MAKKATLDLLTVGNMTFTGDPRYSILHQNHNNWVLVIKNMDKMDEGRFICSVQTFPKQSLRVFVNVHGKPPPPPTISQCCQLVPISK